MAVRIDLSISVSQALYVSTPNWRVVALYRPGYTRISGSSPPGFTHGTSPYSWCRTPNRMPRAQITSSSGSVVCVACRWVAPPTFAVREFFVEPVGE